MVATTGEFHHPGEHGPRRSGPGSRPRAAQGSTSIHSTGISPGFISEAVPIVLTSIQRRLDRLRIEEFADLSSRDSPELLFDLMGYGKDPASFDPGRWAHGAASFGPSLRQLADAVGLPLDTVESTGEVAVATRDHRDRRRHHPRRHGGRPADDRVAVAVTAPSCSASVPPGTAPPSSTPSGTCGAAAGGCVVDGDCPLDVEIRLAVPLERMAESTPGYTANRAVNAVPVVCQAAPGIRTTVDLPQIVPDLSGGSEGGPR